MSDESKSPTGDDSSARKEPTGKEAAKASKKRRLRTVLIVIGAVILVFVIIPKAFHAWHTVSTDDAFAVWGKNDPFFLPAGAEAFKRDIADAKIQFVDTGHFALETHVDEIAAAMKDFLAANRIGQPRPERVISRNDSRLLKKE